MKRVLQVTGLLIFIVVLSAAAWIGPYALQVQRFEASPENGYYADFYVYVSPGAREIVENGGQATILVQPNNSGINSDDPTVHQRDAWWTGFERKAIADELGVVLLVPAFLRPAEDWHILTHAIDRDTLTTEREDLARIDLQLIAMIDQTRASLALQGLSTDERIFIQGFSASGMFANRFAILHPDRVKAATIGSPGGFPVLPVADFEGTTLNYPAGIADLQELTGSPFDAATYNAIPQLIYMGTEDDNDSLDFTDGWEADHAAVVDGLFGSDPLSRWDDAEAIYQEEGANVQFLLVEGFGHDRPGLQDYSTEFFKRVLAEE